MPGNSNSNSPSLRRRRRRAAALTLLEQVLAIPDLTLWTSDLGVYEDTGGTDPAEDTDLVARWTDHGLAQHFDQATSGNRFAYTASSATFGDKPALSMVSNDLLQHSGTAASWNSLHDATGGTLFVCMSNPDATGVVLGTCIGNGSSTQTGINLRRSAGGNYQILVGASSGAGWLVNKSAAVASGLARMVVTLGATAITTRVNGSEIAGLTGDYAAITPDTGDADYAMALGNIPALSFGVAGSFAVVGRIDHAVTAGELAIVESFMETFSP